ncbi:LamG domain-containing protein [Candidatus Babeliales bacterium]|nr:LamG domain-containing protein [Candidatus Babeliales bacterium]
MYFHKPQEKPRKWGSFQDVQYAIRKNAEKIYGIDPDNDVLVMPLFWGLPPLDYSGKNNHGTNHGAIYKDGNLGFDGTNFINVGTNSNLDMGTGNLTLSVWIKMVGNSPDIEHHLVSRASDYQLYIRDATDEFRFSLYDGVNQSKLSSGFTVITDKWYSLVGVRDSGTLRTYVNDIAKNTMGDTTGDINNGGGGDVTIGRRTGQQHLNGLIYEARISNVARTADQIALFYERPWDLYRPVSRPVYFLPSIEAIMNQFQKSNLGSDLFNGALL